MCVTLVIYQELAGVSYGATANKTASLRSTASRLRVSQHWNVRCFTVGTRTTL
jgi:hypothetical protein